MQVRSGLAHLFVERIDNSQIQQGTVSSTQSGDWRGLSGQDLSALVRELEPLVTALAGASRDELPAWLDTLKAQSRIATPSKSVVREALTTMRGIAEKVGASLIAAKITTALAAAAGA